MMWDLAACRADRDDIRQLVASLSERLGRDLDVLDVFFPPSNHHPDEQLLTGVAKTVCHSCPLLVECGEWAARNGQWDGIHGGLRKEQKIALARRLGVKVRTDGLEPCGTPAAARRHRKLDEPVCEPCRRAERARNREWRQRNRAA